MTSGNATLVLLGTFSFVCAALPIANLATYMDSIVMLLEDETEQVRRAAVACMLRLDASTMPPSHAAAIIRRLHDSDQRVRVNAADVIRRLNVPTLTANADVLFEQIRGKNKQGRAIAMSIVKLLDAETLAKHEDEIVEARAKDSYDMVRILADEVLRRINKE